MDKNWLPTLIGTLAAICSMTSFAPQILKIWKERDASSVSLRMYAVTVTGFILWTTYGIMLESWPLVFSNAVCVLMSGTVLAMKWRFSRE
ncbi:SemiSWEET family sugar transporter [Caulobacter sp. NIBR2454]|uniref:SemiSWEET family sugar transporter n=1 Tax=Caulobacter sp. NIBR2454 TaxID=3015996 RepID=UPI0022B69871|nr:SemiSWEET transporter [Caulobacter sp. NIBR2454]